MEKKSIFIDFKYQKKSLSSKLRQYYHKKSHTRAHKVFVSQFTLHISVCSGEFLRISSNPHRSMEATSTDADIAL